MLTDHQLTLPPCSFAHELANDAVSARTLEPTASSHPHLCALQLRKDTRVDLPLWLAKALTHRHFTTMETPAVYGEW